MYSQFQVSIRNPIIGSVVDTYNILNLIVFSIKSISKWSEGKERERGRDREIERRRDK